VLEVLRLHDVRATFFLLGSQVEKFPAVARRIAEAGHDLANHSHSHRSFRSLFPSEITRELERTDAAIAAATGLRPRFVRPPYGRFPESAVALVRERGGDVVLWSVDAADWSDASPERIAEVVVDAATPGAIVLLHDIEPSTVRALPLILAGLRRRGLEPVSVAELLGRPPYLGADDGARVGAASG
jgi:peptidoglycan/xylan/chitin deacetylase (PgdA/CDA1 family)